jgi:hypothetical protein
MENLIKEVLEYIAPPKPVEAPAKGAKGKAPAKDEPPADIYAGKDTIHYKELGQ